MATILPFRGILYNPEKIDDLACVMTPPFDVISEKAQQDFYDSHPQNMIRLILGKQRETDTEHDNRHTRAADCCRLWAEDKVLVRDPAPALYLTAVDFSLEGQIVTRYGFICRVGLEPFERGVILPHEKTFSKVKSDRLDLMRACHTNFSPIFSLYSDEGNRILGALRAHVRESVPDSEFTDTTGMHHRLWRIRDPELQRFATEQLEDRQLFIADGHHRYETALNYREWASRQVPNFNGAHPANSVMMYLSSMQDPGLVVLPAHRLLKAVGETVLSSFFENAAPYFDIEKIDYSPARPEKALERLRKGLKAAPSKNIIGVFLKNRPALYLLTLRANIMDNLFEKELPAVIRQIDVSVLTRLIFMGILGFDNKRLDDESLIGYATRAAEAIEGVESGEYDAAFILNPTKMSQVQAVARKGLIMPRKATYFYPKVVVGQVINTLVPDGNESGEKVSRQNDQALVYP